jgi:signal transduction histidine kinase
MSAPDRHRPSGVPDEGAETTSGLDEVGRLARGLAHDLNNIFTAIQGGAEMARLDAGGDPDSVRASVATVLRAQREGSELVQQLLAFAGPHHPVVETFPPGREIDELSEVLRIRLGGDVTLELELDGDARTAMDRESFRQLILHLVGCARTTLPHGGSVRMVVDRPSGDRGAEAVRLTVIAEGEAMEPETGYAGLRFATVRRIVQRAGGGMRVESTPNGGAAVHVSLPAAPIEHLSSNPERT